MQSKRVAIITGAGSGIGRATAIAFLRDGYCVALAGRRTEHLNETVKLAAANSAPYTSTKHAITGLTKSTSLDGRKYDIACSQIDIGNAATDLTARFKEGIMQAHGAIATEPTMNVEDVARAVLHMANLPLDTNVQFMTIMATKMPFIGRG